MTMSRSALVVIDMLNTYSHPDAEMLIPSVREALPASSGSSNGPATTAYR